MNTAESLTFTDEDDCIFMENDEPDIADFQFDNQQVATPETGKHHLTTTVTPVSNALHVQICTNRFTSFEDHCSHKQTHTGTKFASKRQLSPSMEGLTKKVKIENENENSINIIDQSTVVVNSNNTNSSEGDHLQPANTVSQQRKVVKRLMTVSQIYLDFELKVYDQKLHQKLDQIIEQFDLAEADIDGTPDDLLPLVIERHRDLLSVRMKLLMLINSAGSATSDAFNSTLSVTTTADTANNASTNTSAPTKEVTGENLTRQKEKVLPSGLASDERQRLKTVNTSEVIKCHETEKFVKDFGRQSVVKLPKVTNSSKRRVTKSQKHVAPPSLQSCLSTPLSSATACQTNVKSTFTQKLTTTNNSNLRNLMAVQSNSKPKSKSKKRMNKLKKPLHSFSTKKHTITNKVKTSIATSTATKVYSCEHFKKTLKSANNYRAHYRMHRKIKPYKCTWCSVNFTQKNSAVKHFEVKHGHKNRKQLKNANPNNHIEEDTEYLGEEKTQLKAVQKIEKSKKQTTSTSQLVIALWAPNKGNRSAARFVCQRPGCRYQNRSLCSLKQHEQRHRGESESPFKCNYNTVMRAAVEDDDKADATTNDCSRLFSTKPDLLRHIQRQHTKQSEYNPKYLERFAAVDQAVLQAEEAHWAEALERVVLLPNKKNEWSTAVKTVAETNSPIFAYHCVKKLADYFCRLAGCSCGGSKFSSLTQLVRHFEAVGSGQCLGPKENRSTTIIATSMNMSLPSDNPTGTEEECIGEKENADEDLESESLELPAHAESDLNCTATHLTDLQHQPSNDCLIDQFLANPVAKSVKNGAAIEFQVKTETETEAADTATANCSKHCKKMLVSYENISFEVDVSKPLFSLLASSSSPEQVIWLCPDEECRDMKPTSNFTSLDDFLYHCRSEHCATPFRPYRCLFSGCSSAQSSTVLKVDMIRHIMQVHQQSNRMKAELFIKVDQLALDQEAEKLKIWINSPLYQHWAMSVLTYPMIEANRQVKKEKM